MITREDGILTESIYIYIYYRYIDHFKVYFKNQYSELQNLSDSVVTSQKHWNKMYFIMVIIYHEPAMKICFMFSLGEKIVNLSDRQVGLQKKQKTKCDISKQLYIYLKGPVWYLIY